MRNVPSCCCSPSTMSTVRAGITAGLVATNERKDEFLAMLGHELRHR